VLPKPCERNRLYAPLIRALIGDRTGPFPALRLSPEVVLIPRFCRESRIGRTGTKGDIGSHTALSPVDRNLSVRLASASPANPRRRQSKGPARDPYCTIRYPAFASLDAHARYKKPVDPESGSAEKVWSERNTLLRERLSETGRSDRKRKVFHSVLPTSLSEPVVVGASVAWYRTTFTISTGRVSASASFEGSPEQKRRLGGTKRSQLELRESSTERRRRLAMRETSKVAPNPIAPS